MRIFVYYIFHWIFYNVTLYCTYIQKILFILYLLYIKYYFVYINAYNIIKKLIIMVGDNHEIIEFYNKVDKKGFY